jgi:predicted acyltransferase
MSNGLVRPPPNGKSVSGVEAQGEAAAAAKLGVARPRLVSLDAFRGLTILAMLLVNNVALDSATPRFLTHAGWTGEIHFADYVFPWFLFIVGVAIPWANGAAQARGASGWQITWRLLTRTVVLFGLGCLIDSSLAKRPLASLGVLQLIALAYCGASLTQPLPTCARAVFAALLLTAHTALIRFVPVPGNGAGVFTETANAISHLDALYLQPWGLRGLLSVIPTTALALIGGAVGEVLWRKRGNDLEKVTYLLLGGAALALIGWLWSFQLPYNKPVWTASYILFTAGCATVLLGSLYLAVDVAGARWVTAPLVVFGSNAILAYVAPIMVKIHILQEWTWRMSDGSTLPLQQALQHTAFVRFGTIPGRWAYTLGYIAAWWMVLLWLYRRKVFLRV